MKKHLCDIEVYRNVFLCSIKNQETKETTIWEISERKNEHDKIKEWFSNYKDYLLTFNGVHYDVPVILFLMQNDFEDWEDCTNRLKEFSDRIIREDMWWKDNYLKRFKYHNLWTDVDLFLYWSKMLRLSKKLSLKAFAIQLNYPVIQELPFKPDSLLTSDEIDELIHYNAVHDLGITEMLYYKLLDEIRLRWHIQKEYGLKCMSWDAPKIASEVLADSYAKATFDPERLIEIDYRGQKYHRKQTIEDWLREVKGMSFTRPTIHIGKLLEGFDPHFELSVFQGLFKDICASTDSYSKEVGVIYNATTIKLTYGVGGLHSVNKNESYFSDGNNIVITSDFVSLYPNLIVNYSLMRFPEVLQRYSEIKHGRIKAKKDGDKSKDSLYKLILNSTSGMLDNQYSWLYYPEGALKLRLIGQLILTKLVEKCIIAGYKVISCNTDGIETLLPKSEHDKYMQLMSEIEQQFNLVLEHEIYSKIVYSSVNDYIAITEKGKIKQKGLFVTNPVLSNSVDFLVIPKALEAYYLNGISPKDFIANHDSIFDFCASKKSDKSFEVIWNGQIQQRLNRYYVSSNAPYLYKRKNGKDQHMLKGYGVMLYNNHVEKPMSEYKIDYKFYIDKVNEIIVEINNSNQLKMF